MIESNVGPGFTEKTLGLVPMVPSAFFNVTILLPRVAVGKRVTFTERVLKVLSKVAELTVMSFPSKNAVAPSRILNPEIVSV